MQKLSKITSWILYVLLAITVVTFAFFYFGGGMEKPVIEEYFEPKYTDLVLYYAFIILAIGVVLTFVFAIIQFALEFRDNPKFAFRSLGTMVGFFGLLAITYFCGSDTPLNIVGYEGTQNTEGWLKLTDI